MKVSESNHNHNPKGKNDDNDNDRDSSNMQQQKHQQQQQQQQPKVATTTTTTTTTGSVVQHQWRATVTGHLHNIKCKPNGNGYSKSPDVHVLNIVCAHMRIYCIH